jgi:hypothetical protein
MRGAILIVEGDVDVRLYKRFALQQPHSRAIPGGGKPSLLEVMRIVANRETPGVLAICDADFDRVLNITHPSGIVCADYHDAEMMIVHSDALHAVLGELMNAGPSLDQTITIRDSLVGVASSVGRVRLWSRDNDARLNFKAVDAGAYIHPDLTFDLTSYLSQVIESSFSNADVGQLYEASKSYQGDVDLGELAVGHDFVALLDGYLATHRSDQRIGSDLLGSALRLAFDATHFRRTHLAGHISGWEKSSGFEVLIDDARPLL